VVADTLAGRNRHLLAHLHRDERRHRRSPPGLNPQCSALGSIEAALPTPGGATAWAWSLAAKAKKACGGAGLSSKVLGDHRAGRGWARPP